MSSSAQVAPRVADYASFRVLVLDALSGKPQSNVTIPYLCDEIPHSVTAEAMTDAKGVAVVPYTCKPGNKIELDAVLEIGKEGCGGGVGATLEEIMSSWRHLVPHKDQPQTAPVPGQVILFVKKPTWWQSHIAG